VSVARKTLNLWKGQAEKKMEQQFGLAGLGVMGRNLALNAAGHGFNVVATDPWESARAWSADDVTVTADQAELAARMALPRRILLMVKAGAQVDAKIAGLSPHLAPGDLIIDGGNSRFQDAGRRGAALAETGIFYLGAGNSGGGRGRAQRAGNHGWR
jgi:6-phosphogluconate dehydrogenase